MRTTFRPLLHAGLTVLLCGMIANLRATKLAEVSVADRDVLMVHFLDGEVTFRDDGLGTGAYHGHSHEDDNDTVKTYGSPLSTSNAVSTANWVLKSSDDTNYGTSGQNPSNCYRKSKLNGMAEKEWSGSDYIYEYTMEHTIFLRLPSSMVQGTEYTLEINANTNTDATSETFTFDIFNSPSEALHVNLVGCATDAAVKAADLYLWMGDGSARDYSGFEGNDVYIYNVGTQQPQTVGTVSFWKSSAGEAQGYNFTASNVWNADFSTFSEGGTFRVAVEGVGCSRDFVIGDNVYHDPFEVSVRGFYYMRIGQDSTNGVRPVPRRPLWIPGTDPAGTVVYLTTMHPFHAEWSTFSSGDAWDRPDDFAAYVKSGSPTNPNLWGGHSDALDWDRHLGHVSIIYDMLLPFVLTDGAISDDDLGIAESGNGIPDILDEARYEVDFWLRCRDGQGYSHGLTNPNSSDALYQGGTTAIAAWVNAANCAMLADCFRIAGLTDLSNEYRDSAVVAYEYAGGLSDQMLDDSHGMGETNIRGRDLKMMAAAYLYNVTGDVAYEAVINDESSCTGTTSELDDTWSRNQTWATAAYLLTPQTVNYPTLQSNMEASVIHQAKQKEANYSTTRPSRRATDNNTGYFQTIQNVHRTLIAHTVTDNASDKELLEKAMVLEADWGLGRNPMNMIQMTTATTSLESKRSVVNIYTSGRDDGSPGLHPGHTPYMNVDDWACGMVMGCPSWLYTKGYPSDFGVWPKAEADFNTRYVWAHSEFTPQQTMRGKTALYGYLYGLGILGSSQGTRRGEPQLGRYRKDAFLTIGHRTFTLHGSGTYSVRIVDLSGRTVWSDVRDTRSNNAVPVALAGRRGLHILHVHGNSQFITRRLLEL